MPAGRVLAAPFIAGRTGAQGVTLRAADIRPDGYPTTGGVKLMGRLVEERTGGRIRIQVFHSRQLGDENASLEQTRLGVIDMTRVDTAPLNNLVPATLVAGLPFLFRDTAYMQMVMDGPIGDEVGAGTAAHGLVTLCPTTRVRAASTPAPARCGRRTTSRA